MHLSSLSRASSAHCSGSSPRVQGNRQEWELVSPRALTKLWLETEPRQQEPSPRSQNEKMEWDIAAHAVWQKQRSEMNHLLWRLSGLPHYKFPGLELIGPGTESSLEGSRNEIQKNQFWLLGGSRKWNEDSLPVNPSLAVGRTDNWHKWVPDREAVETKEAETKSRDREDIQRRMREKWEDKIERETDRWS